MSPAFPVTGPKEPTALRPAGMVSESDPVLALKRVRHRSSDKLL